ncbi:FAD-dependent oxidoreductase [Sphingomonas turrisvirgatae]|uniref:Pyridine nucleotide-disulfide oxidoreductase n=1 Tax=Sphingomonas turrisvirgatae TaxID=1888892 RepID=A0A1E3LYW6_9SPHN|nr:FAD-dependent oxidoreductase [Sphingomonas turrisvirgatae]ODP38315.1 pyridine nucleotide-disulfide oxidoreductase [Sphingomonas turrisvirgatae]
MRHIAVIGSGPAGYYTAEAAQKQFGDDVRVDIIDRLPVPFGLIRSGVAPDHQAIKHVSRRYEATALTENVRFVGNVTIGQHISVAELLDLYDAVVLATGAPRDQPLEIPGADLPGVTGSAAFVGWYNGHPDHAALNPPLDGPGAVVIGNGNVALDVARVLAKSQAEFASSDIVAHALAALETSRVNTITLLGRRGPHQIHMTPKELGELGQLQRAAPMVDPADLPPAADDAMLEPGLRKAIAHLRNFAAAHVERPVQIVFDFFAMPVAIEGDGRVERVIVERTALDDHGAAVGTGETYAIPASLVVSCIGYRTPPIEGVPYDDRAGRFANADGRVLPGLYAVGWARRGPTGTIGTNRPDGFAIVDKIAEDMSPGSGKAGRAGLDALLQSRSVDVVTFRDWQQIEAAEIAAARDGAPREKFTSVEAMLDARPH